MVGIPRSKGCRTCVKRRVRCDETRPTCNNCAKGNRSCPGYAVQLVFRDEGPKLKQKSDRVARASERRYDKQGTSIAQDSNGQRRDDSPSVSSSSSDDDDDALSRMPEQHSHVDRCSAFPDLARIEDMTDLENSLDTIVGDALQLDTLPLHMPVYSPALFQKQLLSVFTEAVAPTTKDFVPPVMRAQGQWLQHLPELSGYDVLLDTTVRAVALVQIGRHQSSEVFVDESRQHYSRALRLLSHALKKKDMGLSDRTLCAVALLSFYEMFASSNNASWLRHAGGVGALMRERGPQRHRYGLGREVLRAYRHTLLIDAFHGNATCFLNEPEWRQVQAQIYDDICADGSIPENRMELFDAAETFFSLSTEATRLCSHSFKLSQIAFLPDTDSVDRQLSTISELKVIRGRMHDAVTQWESGLSAANALPELYAAHDPIFPEQYEYKNLFLSLFYASHRSALACVNRAIVRSGRKLTENGAISPDFLSEHLRENRTLAIKCCQSVSYMLRSSFLGPFYAIFALRLASQDFDRDEPKFDWTIGKLFEISNSSFLMARHLPWYEQQVGTASDLEKAACRGSQQVRWRYSEM